MELESQRRLVVSAGKRKMSRVRGAHSRSFISVTRDVNFPFLLLNVPCYQKIQYSSYPQSGHRGKTRSVQLIAIISIASEPDRSRRDYISHSRYSLQPYGRRSRGRQYFCHVNIATRSVHARARARGMTQYFITHYIRRSPSSARLPELPVISLTGKLRVAHSWSRFLLPLSSSAPPP